MRHSRLRKSVDLLRMTSSTLISLSQWGWRFYAFFHGGMLRGASEGLAPSSRVVPQQCCNDPENYHTPSFKHTGSFVEPLLLKIQPYKCKGDQNGIQKDGNCCWSKFSR